MSEDQKRLSELSGQLNQIMRVTTAITADKARVIAEIDSIEKRLQSEKLESLTPEQQCALDRICEGCE